MYDDILERTSYIKQVLVNENANPIGFIGPSACQVRSHSPEGIPSHLFSAEPLLLLLMVHNPRIGPIGIRSRCVSRVTVDVLKVTHDPKAGLVVVE